MAEVAHHCLSTAFGGTVLGARLALANFYRQKIWEQKAASYTAMFEAIHVIERWHTKHRETFFAGAILEEERKKALQAEANKAEEDLERRLAGNAWLLPLSYRDRITKMTAHLRLVAVPGTLRSVIFSRRWWSVSQQPLHRRIQPQTSDLVIHTIAPVPSLVCFSEAKCDSMCGKLRSGLHCAKISEARSSETGA
jgi:hypothetical protein